jgi:transcriptional regulator with XRE-family HTH domain
MSGNKLAEAIGRSQNYVAIRLRKESSFTLTDIESIAQALGVSPRSLLQG